MPRLTSSTKSILKSGGIYGAANAITAGAQFTAILLFARTLPPDDFGHLSLFNVLYIVLSMLVGLGLTAAIQHAFFHMTVEKFGLLVSTSVKAITLLSLALSGLIIVLPEYVIAYTGLSRVLVLYALTTASLFVCLQILLIILQTEGEISTYLYVVFMQISIHLAGAMMFVFTRQDNWQLAVLAQSASPLLSGTAAVIIMFLKGYIVKQNAFALFREGLQYSLPLVPHQVAGWAIVMVDRFIIAMYLGATQTGVYSLSFQIAQAVNISSSSFNQALVPVLFRELAAPKVDSRKLSRLDLSYAVGLAIFSLLLAVLFFIAQSLILPPDYGMANLYVPWLIFSFFILALSRIPTNYLLYHRQTSNIASATIVASMISVALNLFLIPKFGVIAACWSNVAAFTTLFIISTWLCVLCRKR